MRQQQEIRENTRKRIADWIENLPDHDYNCDRVQQHTHGGVNNSTSNNQKSEGSDISGDYLSISSKEEINNKLSEENTPDRDATLDRAFYVKGKPTQFESPVKCDISTDNLLPNRLRFRFKSGVKDDCKKILFEERFTDKGIVSSKVVLSEDCTNSASCFNDNHTYTKAASIIDQSSEIDTLKSTLDEITSANMDVQFKCPTPIDEEQFGKHSQAEKMGTILSKLNGLCLKLEEVDVQLKHDTDGVVFKQGLMQKQQDEEAVERRKITKENGVLRGLVQRQFCQIRELNDKVANLTARSMQNNLTISGITGDGLKENDVKQKAVTFFKEQVEIDADESEIYVAHRVGKFYKDQKYPRLLVVRCTPALKERVLENVTVLKDKTNSEGNAYYMNKQLPEKILEQNREIRQTIKTTKEKESTLPVKDRTKIEVRNKTLFLNGSPVKKELPAPEPIDLFPEKPEKDKIEKMKLASSDLVSDKGSDFQAYALKTGHIAEVKRANRKVKTLHPAATHVVAAFNLKSKCGFQDDEEHSAGHKLLAAIKKDCPINTAVFVARVYGGTHLGQRRHKIYRDVAVEAINRIGKPTHST